MSPRRNGKNRVLGQPRPSVVTGLRDMERQSDEARPAGSLLSEAAGLVSRFPIISLCVVAVVAVLAGLAINSRNQ